MCHTAIGNNRIVFFIIRFYNCWLILFATQIFLKRNVIIINKGKVIIIAIAFM